MPSHRVADEVKRAELKCCDKTLNEGPLPGDAVVKIRGRVRCPQAPEGLAGLPGSRPLARQRCRRRTTFEDLSDSRATDVPELVSCFFALP